MDHGDKITLVKLLDLLRRLLHEMDMTSTPYMAFNNLMMEMVSDYHAIWSLDARSVVQKLLYAAIDLPGEMIPLANARSDIIGRLERDHLTVSGKNVRLQYELPLDDDHLNRNPPLRRITSIVKMEKSTQTEGTFQKKPVRAIILD